MQKKSSGDQDFVRQLREQLKRLTEFIGVAADEKYLTDCAAIVYESPNKSRLKVSWNDNLLGSIQKEMEKFPFLHGYTFAS